jgi:hypothetical protein
MKKILVFALALLSGQVSFAQNQYNQWAFGWHAGFDVGTSTVLATPPLITSGEQSASWCNSSGNLWFYTNGNFVYDAATSTSIPFFANSNPNNTSAMQGVLIVPKVGGPADQFYIFNVSDAPSLWGSANYGLTYKIYDATTLSAVGTDVSMGFTPGTFGSFTTENLTAIPHANGTDYWVIVKPVIFAAGTPGAVITSAQPSNQPAGATNSSLYAYLVSASGVSATPVISNAGYASGITSDINYHSQIKSSPNCQYAAAVERTGSLSGNTHLYSFDNNTGTFTHLQTMPYLAGYNPLSVSFSSNSKVLYVTGSYPPVSQPNTGGENLRQYDLGNFPCNSTIPFCDLTNAINDPAHTTSVVQLAPNGKIYRSHWNSEYIDVITSPNNIGCSNMGYVNNGQQVAIPPNANCKLSLPNNIDGQFGQNTPTTAWPKTTSNTFVNDQANAIESDQNGDVYAAGQFKNQTYFEGLLVGNPAIVTQTYLAKYDNCSGLEWVARAQGTTNLTVNSMTLDQGLGYVYYSGRYSGSVRFYSGITSSGANSCSPTAISFSGNGVYIAIYNYSGCLLSVHTIPDGAMQHLSAHVTVSTQFSPNPSQKRVYLAVNESDGKTITLHALAHVAAPALTVAWTKTTYSSMSASVSDISSYKNTVCMTGTYTRDISWNATGIFATTAFGIEEAFVLAISDISNTPTAFLSKDMDPANVSSSKGAGVHCLNSTDIYLTGYYKDFIGNPFSTGTGYSLLANGTRYCGYVVRHNTGIPSTNWARCMRADGDVYGVDVIALGTAVYLAGYWEGTTFYADNTLLPPTLNSKKHMYVMQMENNGNFNTAPCWQNHSIVNNDVTQWVRPSRITANTSYVYVDGFYSGTATMLNETGANAPLASTASTNNSFVWRYNPLAGGVSLRQPAEELTTIENTNAPVLFPNPATGVFNINLQTDGTSQIEVYSMNGELLFSKTTNAATEQIDASQWASGIYLVRIVRTNEVFSQKLIKE